MDLLHASPAGVFSIMPGEMVTLQIAHAAETRRSGTGDVIRTYTKAGTITGLMKPADALEQQHYDQAQHPISHVLAAQGLPVASTEDLLRLNGRVFVVNVRPDNVSEQGVWTLYRLLERPDLAGEFPA